MEHAWKYDFSLGKFAIKLHFGYFSVVCVIIWNIFCILLCLWVFALKHKSGLLFPLEGVFNARNILEAFSSFVCMCDLVEIFCASLSQMWPLFSLLKEGKKERETERKKEKDFIDIRFFTKLWVIWYLHIRVLKNSSDFKNVNICWSQFMCP